MSFDDKIKLIYDMLIDGEELTKENIIARGLCEEDLWQLEDYGVLLKVKKKPYRLKSVEKFRKYGVKLLLTGMNLKADRCFEKCYEKSPTELKICYHVLLSRLRSNDYEGALEVFINLNKNKKSFMDTNFILFLLSFIIELPDEYRDKVLNFEEKDISLRDTPYSYLENICRSYAFKQEFATAISQIAKLCNKNNEGEYSPKFQLIKGLLNMIANQVKDLQREILRLVKNKDYQEVVNVLEAKSKTRQLSHKEQSILLVAKEILRLTKERVVLEPNSKKIIKSGKRFNMEEMLKAIKGNNFELAYVECNGFTEEYGLKEENAVLDNMLKYWNKLSSKVRTEACILTVNDMSVPLYEVGYTGEDEDVIGAYNTIKEGLRDNLSLEDIIRGIGFLNNEPKQLVKLVYARYCYYNAMKCYDLAYELYDLGAMDYNKAVRLFYGYVACADRLVNDVEKVLSKSPRIQIILTEVKNYKKSFQVSSETKRLVRE